MQCRRVLLDVACGDDACFRTTIPEDSYPSVGPRPSSNYVVRPSARLTSNYVLYQVNQSVPVRPSLPMRAVPG